MKLFDNEFTFSKRQLGYIAIVLGIVGVVGLLGFDQLGISDPQGGFGPSQTLGVIGSIVTIVVGLSLIPLGDTPA